MPKTSMIRRAVIPILILTKSVTLSSTVLAVELQPILENIAISPAQQHVQQTPIDYWNGKLYLTYIASASDSDGKNTNLKTMVRMGVESEAGLWNWSDNLVEDRTIFDTWHTAPSIGLDKDGYVHIAYNMHNLPWQYKVSDSPESIEKFNFMGQEISQADIDSLKNENKTNFPSLGTSSIPGNQITYPQFVRDSNNDLHVTYRFAAKPARKFEERTMSSGIAKYDTQLKSWTAIGEPVLITKDDYKVTSFPWFTFGDPELPIAIASKEGWTSYYPRLSFGPNDRTNLNLFWRKGVAGELVSKPCFVTTNDLETWNDANGKTMELPLTPDQCSNLNIDQETLFYSVGNSVSDSIGNPYFILSPENGIRQIYSYRDNEWQIQDSPYGATNLFIDSHDSLWAVATGLKLLRKKKDSQDWEMLYENIEATDCYPRVVLNSKKSTAYIYSTTCDTKFLNVFSVSLVDVNNEQ